MIDDGGDLCDCDLVSLICLWFWLFDYEWKWFMVVMEFW
jgi:hypothetical protein